MRHPFAAADAIGQAHAVSQATASSEPAYATLYATCAALMIAVLVVFYFDQRVRDHLTPRQRGYAIGSLGGVIGTGLLVCLFALAGMIKDTALIRDFITIYTLVFLTATFGAAISAWGREDVARRQRASTPQVAVPPVPIPRGAATEREPAAELVAAGLFVVGQTAPAVVIPNMETKGVAAEKERLRQLVDQWMTLQPELIAVGAWFPSAEVRESLAKFLLAGHEALKQTGVLFLDPQTLTDKAARAEWQAKAEAAYQSLETAWDTFASALNAGASNRSRARPAKSRQTLPAHRRAILRRRRSGPGMAR
jgi:hypothetical protein